MRRSLVVLVAFLVFVPVNLASQPGQPLDCSDFVIDEPGFSCRKLRDCGTEPTTGNPDFPCAVGGGATADAEGRIAGAEYREPVVVNCGGADVKPGRLEVKIFNGGGEQLIAHADGRCSRVGSGIESIIAHSVAFDAVGGRLLLYFESSCKGSGACDYDRSYWVAAFEGFTTLFDVIDSYVPTSSSFGFRVPQRPEGLLGVEHFDTFAGELTTPLELSVARPLQCSYPETPPSAGDYLTFPAGGTPAPGHAIYYLTSVTYQGQTRAGRQALDGTLHGRDVSRLPACVIEPEARQ